MYWIESSQKKYNVQLVHEKMFNIFSYQENANKNYIEIPSHPSQNGYHQEKEC
jgi:hypothetical protein